VSTGDNKAFIRRWNCDPVNDLSLMPPTDIPAFVTVGPNTLWAYAHDRVLPFRLSMSVPDGWSTGGPYLYDGTLDDGVPGTASQLPQNGQLGPRRPSQDATR
jgi:hypothetical protein